MNHRRYTYFTGEDILLLKRRYTSFLKETHRSFIRSGMGALLLWLLLLTACVGEELQKPLLGEGEGYLTLQIGAISAEIQTAPLTKTPTQLDVPKPEDLTINIKNKNTQENVFTGKPTGESMTVTLKTGTYIVEAYYGTNNDIQTEPYFYGSSGEITIEALKNTRVEFSASLANAMITPVVSQNLSKHYTSYEVEAKVNGSTLVFPSGKSLFAAAERTISLTFTGTNQLGVETSYTSPETKALQAGKNYLLQCDPKFSECSSIQVNATIDPIVTKDGWLTGSKVSLSYSSPDGAQIGNISSWHVDLHYNNNVIRTYEGGAPNATIMDQDSNWPYVPKGSEITAYVVIEGDHIPVKTSKTVNPIPSKVIEITGTTSYDLYLAEKISKANEMNAETIEGIGARAKIDATLLSQFGYSFSLTYDNEEPSYGTSVISVGDKTGQSWGNHPITATMVFDGQNIEAKKDCHITGLPYKANPPKKSGDHPWIDQAGNNKWTDNCAQLYYSSGKYPIIVSPTFHVPSNIKVGITTEIYREHYKWSSLAKGDLCIYQYNSSTEKEKSLYKSELADEQTYKPNPPLPATMSSELPAFFIRYNYMAATGYTDVYYFNVAYQSE